MAKMLTPEDLELILENEKTHINIRISDLHNNRCYRCMRCRDSVKHYKYTHYKSPNRQSFCSICDKCFESMSWPSEREYNVKLLEVQEIFMIKTLC